MSLFGSMNTAISGMNAQTNKLSAVGDNIANSDTTGYKRAQVKFSTFLIPSTKGTYASGGVNSMTSYDISTQGDLKATNSGTDIGINGKGFFVVRDTSGADFLTRAGSFRVDANGYLTNGAGLTLMGFPYIAGSGTSQVNGLTGMEKIQVVNSVPVASATQNVVLGPNLDARKGVTPAANLPSTNNATGVHFDEKVSVSTYDPLGREILYDVYYTKKADAVAANGATPAQDAQWEVSIYRKDEANAATGGFPYAGPNGAAPTVAGNTLVLSFNPGTGKVSSTPTELSVVDSKTIPAQTIRFDFARATQLAANYSASTQSVDGQKAAKLDSVKIDPDGMMYAIYSDNTSKAIYRISLADVPSPDSLEPMGGNTYRANNASGTVFTGYPGDGSFGFTKSGSLESSNVDLASELTDMIQAQRNYTANTKVFQTGSDLMDVLVNLKR